MLDKIMETFRKFFGKKPEPKRTALVQDFKKIASIGSSLVIPAVLLVGYVGSTKHYNAKKSSSSQQIKYIESDVTLTKAKLDNQAEAQSHDLVNKKFGKILHLVPESYRKWSIHPPYHITIEKLHPWEYLKIEKSKHNLIHYLKEKNWTTSTKIRYLSQKIYYKETDTKNIDNKKPYVAYLNNYIDVNKMVETDSLANESINWGSLFLEDSVNKYRFYYTKDNILKSRSDIHLSIKKLS